MRTGLCVEQVNRDQTARIYVPHMWKQIIAYFVAPHTSGKSDASPHKLISY